MRRGAETVTIIRGVDDGGPVMGNGPAATDRFEVDDCLTYPNTVTETVSRKTGTEVSTPSQDTVVFGLTVLMPAGTDIRPTDQVEVNGVPYDVNGLPSVWKSPSTGRRGRVEVQLKGGTG